MIAISNQRVQSAHSKYQTLCTLSALAVPCAHTNCIADVTSGVKAEDPTAGSTRQTARSLGSVKADSDPRAMVGAGWTAGPGVVGVGARSESESFDPRIIIGLDPHASDLL